jgi:hypothetical protein
MAGHSRSKNGVALLAYVPAIPVAAAMRCQIKRDARHKAGHDVLNEPRRWSADYFRFDIG